MAAHSSDSPREIAPEHPPPAAPSDELVDFLTCGEHPVLAGRRSDLSMAAFREAVRRNFVRLTFTDTQGETELGFELDGPQSDFSQADFDRSQGTALLTGTLRLNNVPVRVFAEIDLSNLQGRGRLELAEPSAASYADPGADD